MVYAEILSNMILMLVSLIFRSKKRKEFSIENVFLSLVPSLIKADYNVSCDYLPNGRYNSFFSILQNVLFVMGIRADIYHITGETYFMVLALLRKKTILTIHDMVMLEKSKGVKKFLFEKFWFELPIRYATAVTVISEKTKKEIENYFPKIKRNIHIIPNPYGDYLHTVIKHFNSNCPIILVVGTRDNKNLERIIYAAAGLKCKLNIIGNLSENQLKILSENKIVFYNSYNLSNKEVFEHYVNCDIVCFPSLYEGFGMPIIEAQKVGRVVITSNLQPMCDVAGKGAILVNPYDYLDIRKAIIQVTQNAELRNRLIELGIKNTEKYSPETIADLYKQIYETTVL